MYFLIILFFTISTTLSYSQQISEWRNYTDMKNVRFIAIDNNIIWAAADGGVFSYNTDENSYTKYSKIDGLNGVSITAATVDKYGKIWFGSSNGIIDVYNPVTNSFRTVLDIFNNTEKTSKSINELNAIGDTIFVASDFGISLVNAANYLFFDTFSKFGGLTSNTPVNSVFKSGLIYACTDAGIAIQKTGATNLSAPESWNVYRTTSGLPSDSITKIVFYNSLLIAATSRGLSFFNDTSWSAYIPQLADVRINDMIVAEGSLFLITASQNILRYSDGELTQIYSAPGITFRLGYSASTGILAATSSGILKLNESLYLHPNGPAANKFPDMTVDNNGILWAASGSDNTAVGFYNYDGNVWNNYNISTTPALTSNTYFRVFSASGNRKIFGNWGQGIAVYYNGEITTYKDNLGFLGIQTNPDFIVISDIAQDSKNNIWLLNYGAADRKYLSRSTDLENWTSYSIPSIGNIYVEQAFHLAIDQYDTKWFAVQRIKQGLFYFNEGNNPDPEVTSDDVSGYLNKSSGLNSDFITCVAVDRRGDLWVGTSLGVNIINRLNTVLSGNPQLNPTSVFSLRQQTITAILVDPLNQKWIGTNLGLFLVNSDGTSLLASFNSRNSALLSDQIISLAIDENSGTIYVGTDNGLTSFKTTSVKPNESFEELFVYPNPFMLNKQNNLITIDGLIRDTDIKILTINGKLVKEFTTPGGRVALWDGRDEFGELVSSGIYFIVAFDQEGNDVAKTKIAVLREE